MRRLLLIVVSIFFVTLSNAQIPPPKQTDTLIITAVKYNYSDIDRENWPCEVIYKSTRDIRIGTQTFNILEADSGWGIDVIFLVYDVDDKGKKEHELLFDDEGDGTVVLVFSGYEFRCYKKKPVRGEEVSSDRRALFHAADKVTDALKAGHAQGNIKTGETFGEPNAKLAGRSVNGTLPRPSYPVQASGKVVVEIYVDNYGNVQKAVAGVEGTTVADKSLWQAARKAALGAHFNMSADAPAIQKGTITYTFMLK